MSQLIEIQHPLLCKNQEVEVEDWFYEILTGKHRMVLYCMISLKETNGLKPDND